MTLHDLCQQYATEGRIEAIIQRPARGEAAVRVDEARAEPGLGLIGDRRANRPGSHGRRSCKREITLFQAEHIPIVADWCGMAELDPVRLRRNLVISGLNLVAMRSPFANMTLEWAIGEEVRIQVTGPCDPCSKMEKELGMGGYNALRGHGGMTARILAGGLIRLGDRVWLSAANPIG